MEEIYKMLGKKLHEMQENGEKTIALSFQEFTKIYQIVCFMMQIKTIANWEDVHGTL